MSGGGGKGSDLSFVNVVLLSTMSVMESNKSQEYSFLYYIELTSPVITISDTVACSCLGQGTDDEVNHSRWHGPTSLVKPNLNVRE